MLEAVQSVILLSQCSGHLTQAQQTWLLLKRPSAYLSVSIQLQPGYTELFLHERLRSTTSVLLSHSPDLLLRTLSTQLHLTIPVCFLQASIGTQAWRAPCVSEEAVMSHAALANLGHHGAVWLSPWLIRPWSHPVSPCSELGSTCEEGH